MITPDQFTAVAEQLLPQARVAAVRRLTGGVSADVHALELEGTNGLRRTVVVRQNTSIKWKPRQKQGLVMEYALLQVLYQAGLPVPEPLLLDISGQWLPQPFLVMAFVDGSTEVPINALNKCLDVMAATLTGLHALPKDRLPTLPERTNPLPELYEYLPATPIGRKIRAYLSKIANSEYQGSLALLHGDFWPGNLLWKDDQLVAVLDWEDAALGDPVSDVAGCRLELLWKYGPEAVDHFTHAYSTRANGNIRSVDAQRLALWEIHVGCAANYFMGEWGLDPARIEDMRKKTDIFVETAAGILC